MSIRAINIVFERSSLKGSDLLLLVSIADQANDDGEAWPSLETLREKNRFETVRGLQVALKRVEGTGELKVEQRLRDDGRGNLTNLFTIDLDLLLSRPQRYFYSQKQRQQARAVEAGMNPSSGGG